MNKPIARKTDIVVQALKDETLIYDLRENRAYCLNETSALVWKLCDGNRNTGEIRLEVSKKLNAHLNEEFVWLAVEELKNNNLLEKPNDLMNQFDGLSRREVIRKVGFASVVALPLISSIVAPETVAAQSCGNIFDPCQPFPDTCCPGRDCSFPTPGTGICCFDDGSIPPDGAPRMPGSHCTQVQSFCVSQFCCSGNATLGPNPSPNCPQGPSNPTHPLAVIECICA